MADAKITALTALTAATTDDIIPIVDSPGGSPVTKKITYANLIASFSAIGQLPFPATQSASADANTLDDYEEGSWTPVLKFGGGTTGITYSVQTGIYVTIGKLVLAIGHITLSAKGSSTGAATIEGLPFAIVGVTSSADIAAYFSMTGLTGAILGTCSASAVTLRQTAATGVSAITDAVFTATSDLYISTTYSR